MSDECERNMFDLMSKTGKSKAQVLSMALSFFDAVVQYKLPGDKLMLHHNDGTSQEIMI